MALTSQQVNQLVEVLVERGGLATKSEVDRAVADVLKRTQQREAKGNVVSLSRIIRGLRIVQGLPALDESARQADVDYLHAHCEKALVTTGTPGSYLVPTIQADEIIQMLALGSVARSAGVRVWPMRGIQKMTIPTALTAPLWVWTVQNSQTTATDPNLGQLAFDLKERRSLVLIPNQLLAVSVPSFDTVLSQMIGLAAGEHEDATFFGSSQAAGGPVNILGVPSISTFNVGGSANGGNLSYQDLLATMAKAAAVKAKPPFCWFMSPRTFYQRVMGLVDANSRPIFVPTATEGLYNAPPTSFYQGRLLGWPVFVTPFISETEALGSGSNLSHLIFTNPNYLHIAQDDVFALAVSTEFAFDQNMTALRAVQHLDFGAAPPQGVVALMGIS